MSLAHEGASYTGPSIWIDGDLREEYEFDPAGAGFSFSSAVVFQRLLSPVFGWESGLEYERVEQGFRYEVNSYHADKGRLAEQDSRYKISHNKFRVPFLLQMRFADWPQVLLEAGAFGAFHLGTAGKVHTQHSNFANQSGFNSNPSSSESLEHLVPYSTRMTWGLAGRVGLEFVGAQGKTFQLSLFYEKQMGAALATPQLSSYRAGFTAAYLFSI